MKLSKIITLIAIASLPLIAGCVSKAERQQYIAVAEEELYRSEAWLNPIFAADSDLTEEERSRGRALLDEFGNEHMPRLSGKYQNARKELLEIIENHKEFLATLKEENIDPEKNETAIALGKKLMISAANYWKLLYELSDYYSQNKIGIITGDELAEADAKFAKQE